MLQDPIADMLTRIRNANQRKHETVGIPANNTIIGIAKILKKEGYITDFAVSNDKVVKAKRTLNITLKYSAKERVINGIKRISKPGLRVYSEVDKFPKVFNGYGIAIISTSKGLMTDKEARDLNVGGEILAWVW